MSIPKKLQSDKAGKNFSECSMCKVELTNQRYFIEKAFQKNLDGIGHTTIFEYAICENCKRQMMKKVSQESMAKMQEFMLNHQEELDEFIHAETDMEHCSFTGKSVEDMEEYHVVAVIKDGTTEFAPMVFGGKIMEIYQGILSEKTKESFDDFYNDFIDIPPELAKILSKDRKPVIF